MKVDGIDERNLVGVRDGGNFVFIYEGGDGPTSWSVDSYLLSELTCLAFSVG